MFFNSELSSSKPRVLLNRCSGAATSFTMTFSAVDENGNPVTFTSSPLNAAPGDTFAFDPSNWEHLDTGTVNVTITHADGQQTELTLNGPSAPPTIVGEKAIMAGRRRHQRVVAFEIDFSGSLDPAQAGNPANYALGQLAGRGRHRTARRVNVTAAYNGAAHSVTLTLASRAKFVKAGQLLIKTQSPGGVLGANGASLASGGQPLYSGDLAFTIARQGRRIAPFTGPGGPII